MCKVYIIRIGYNLFLFDSHVSLASVIFLPGESVCSFNMSVYVASSVVINEIYAVIMRVDD